MLPAERHAAIIDTLRSERIVRAAELAKLLGVSVVTVRRDIDALDEAGLLEKIHGGAKLPGSAGTDEPGFDLKATQAEEEKTAIAREALSLVHDGMAVGLSAGTTTWALAKLLAPEARITVVTNSVRVAGVFWAAGSRSTVILTGGERTPSDALVGPVATAALSKLHLDLLFLGVHGMDPDAGFTTPNLLEAEMNRAFIKAARRVVVLADHTKWGTAGISTIAALDDADEVISDDRLGAEAQRLIKERAGRLRLAHDLPRSA
ncbi:DeoR/GlpR family DNA-binding transcription regulator [Paenarthrobacter sp. DKR-5]|uniref:DeoR/GlpR family DNA-binding transcription regulator n=1 Tax=Paenarthrobacter sp. DKR-5 TaxID=2835535 RepID=UPI001BDC44C4|nr:DeoR/GlpR family DNA-binding transcription regulator [Paenarthrobacter sp. DKR-5]MBT1004187.1 DeoR/GlpR family DNA-binding transcription regulator [Paenarthrobacter sp. DKR-5]